MNAFPDLTAFRAIYPEACGTVAHSLSGHSMFELESLVALAARMRPVDVEYNRGDLPVEVDPKSSIGNGLGVEETIRSIEANGSWMVLKFVEQDAAYRDLLSSTLGALLPVVAPTTGAMLKQEGFIFISSPNSMTPFHFDPEHNILLQLRGTKAMTVFPAGDDTVVDSTEHERFHAGGHRNLPWRDEIAPRGRTFELSPGDGLYVPVKAPHFVRNGPEVSVSFSITWRSEWSYRESDAHGMNAVLRRLGADPRAPHRYPHDNRPKSVGYRALRKLGRVLGR